MSSRLEIVPPRLCAEASNSFKTSASEPPPRRKPLCRPWPPKSSRLSQTGLPAAPSRRCRLPADVGAANRAVHGVRDSDVAVQCRGAVQRVRC